MPEHRANTWTASNSIHSSPPSQRPSERASSGPSELGKEGAESEAAADKSSRVGEGWQQTGMQRGVADGGSWEVGHSGKGEGRGERGRCRHKERGRKADGKTEGKLS